MAEGDAWPGDAFFTLHDGLPREGPGEAADVQWAVAVARPPQGARICDAGCGPGADLPVLRAAVPFAQVVGLDLHPPFVAAAQARVAGMGGIEVAYASLRSDGADLRAHGPFDLIWCAGAIYFVGVVPALTAWAEALSPGGAVAFSEPCWFTDTPSEAAREMWAQYPAMRHAAGIDAWVREAGWRTIATRVVGDAAWEAYFRPLEARARTLRPGADPPLARVLDEGVREAALWRQTRREAGYLLSVVRPA